MDLSTSFDAVQNFAVSLNMLVKHFPPPTDDGAPQILLGSQRRIQLTIFREYFDCCLDKVSLLNSVLFTRVSHLMFIGLDLSGPFATYFPNLTHICLSYHNYHSDWSPVPYFKAEINKMPNLEMFVVMGCIFGERSNEKMNNWVLQMRVTDRRVYAADGYGYSGGGELAMGKWERVMRGLEPSIWEHARQYTESFLITHDHDNLAPNR